ncbi:MAG: transporter substrate-binding domain-containing protein [Lentisphaerae bacterium]|nr:transporter substrate-binding domain-containing protein [Lentisphaerota bacterium]
MKTQFQCIVLFLALTAALFSGCGKKSAETGKGAKFDLSKPGMRIGVPEGAAAMTVGEKKYPKAKLVYFNSLGDGYLAVRSKKIDAFLFDRNSMMYVTLTDPGHLALLDEKIADESIVIGMPKKHKKLCGEVNAFIKQYREDGTYDAMFKRWCQSAALPAVPDIPQPVKPTRKLIVGTEGLNPPMNFFDSQRKLSGFDIEFTRRLALYLNAEIELKNMTYPALLSSLETGKIDLLIANLNATTERGENVLFSDSYVDSSIAALIHKDNCSSAKNTNGMIQKVTDLSGKQVGVFVGGNLNTLTNQFVSGVDYVYFNDNHSAVQALIANKVKAVLLDEPIAKNFVSRNPDTLKIADIFVEDNYGFALPKNSKLRDAASAVVKKMHATGELAQLKTVWCGSDPTKKILTDWAKKFGSTGKNGVLRAALAPYSEPLCYIGSDGSQTGYEIDVLNRIAAELDMKLDLISIVGGARMEMIASGKADLSGGSMSITKERMEKVDFVHPHYKGGVTILVRKEQVSSAQTFSFQKFVKKAVADLKTSFMRTFVRESRWRLVLDGLLITVAITIAATVSGTILAFPVWFLRTAKNKFVQFCGKAFIYLLQGTPILVLLMVLYYLVFASMDISAVLVAIIGFSLNFAAYAGEMLRTGIDSVPRGQREAALALGFNRFQTFTKVVLPQALRQILPVYRGEFINMLKSTSIVGYIAIQDLTKASDIIRSRTYEAFFPLIATALIYFATAWFLAGFLVWLDNRLDPAKRRSKKMESEK